MSGILITSFSATQPEELIKNILGASDLPKPEQNYTNIKSYPWHLETKYYTVNLFLHTVDDIVACPAFVDTIEAMVIHFDPLEEKSFENLEAQLPVLSSYEAEVQILACDSLNQAEENIKYSDRSNKYLEWCVKNKFELVELFPSNHVEEEDEEEEDDYEEVSGYRRILSALQAHVWPHLKMKDKCGIKVNVDAHSNQPLNLGATASASSGEMFVNKEQSRDEKLDSLLGDEFLQSIDSGSHLEFEELFQKFYELKEKASALAGEERKRYAEKVTVAFWKAIGGDEEEVAGLSDDD